MYIYIYNVYCIVYIFIWIIFQATDQNQDYGAVYEGKDVSKTTDVNPDYDDYDYFHA